MLFVSSSMVVRVRFASTELRRVSFVFGSTPDISSRKACASAYLFCRIRSPTTPVATLSYTRCSICFTCAESAGMPISAAAERMLFRATPMLTSYSSRPNGWPVIGLMASLLA